MTNLEKGQIRKFLLGGIQALIKKKTNKQKKPLFIYTIALICKLFQNKLVLSTS